MLWHVSRLQANLVEAMALQNATLYSQTVEEFRSLYSSEVVEAAKAYGMEVTHDYKAKQGAIPLPATLGMLFGNRIADKGVGGRARLYSDYPFPWRKAEGGSRDDFEREALEHLRQSPNQPFVRFEDFQGRPSIRYATAVIMQSSCVGCHNTHPDSPKTNWQEGDVRGVSEVILPLDSIVSQTQTGMQETFLFMGAMSLIGFSILAIAISSLRRSSANLARRARELEHEITERQRAEQALSKSETTTRALINAVPDLMFRMRKDGTYLEFKPAKDFDTVKPPAELIGKTEYEVMPAEFAEMRMQYVEKALQTGEVQILEYQLGLQGELHHEEARIVASGDDEVLVIVRDITKHKQAERERERLLAAEHEQRLLAETLREVTLALTSQINHEAVLDEILHQVQRIVPYSTANIMLLKENALHIVRWRGYQAFGYEESIAKLVQPLEQFPLDVKVIRSRKPLVITDTRQEPDWVVLEMSQWVRSYLSVPIYLHDRVLGLLRLDSDTPGKFSAEDAKRLQPLATAAAIALDKAQLYEHAQQEISERKRTEKKLRDAEAKYRKLVEQLPAITFTVEFGEVNRTTYISPQVESILGFSQAEWLADPDLWIRQLHPDDRQYVLEEVRRKDMTQEPLSIEYRVLARDGRTVWLHNQTTWVQAEPGQTRYTHGIMFDITERKQVEEALITYAAKLEQSNRELQDFAYVASHDLQEPLRKVQAFGDRLQTKYSETLDDQGRDYLTRMQNAAARMQILIQDLLTYSRVTTRRRPFSQVNLTQIMNEVQSDLEIQIEQVGGRLEIGDLPIIEVDPTQIRQLFLNLISNALKFHRAEAPPLVKIHGSVHNHYDNCPTGTTCGVELCQIMVEDNGIGFDEKYLDRIFQVFQRLHGRGEYEGTGVGLAICRKIVERHGGCITANSIPGQGTTFIVTLPVRQARGE